MNFENENKYINLEKSFPKMVEIPDMNNVCDDIINTIDLDNALNSLKPTHKDIVILYFYNQYTLDQIAKIYGVSHQRINEIITNSLIKLRYDLTGEKQEKKQEEKKEKDITPYGMLCVLLAVNVTIKLSSAIMLLLVLKPAAVLLKEKRYGQIGMYLCMGILAVFPYLARNVILSGWLVYPFPAIDLFSFDWKIPVGEAEYDAEEIKVYAKGMTDVLLKDTPMSQWLPNWFAGLKGLEKIWILSSVASVAGGALVTIWGIFRKKQEIFGGFDR